MEFRKQKPIYLQIADRLMEQILSGDPAAEERMPSVRDVAASMGVNPNTVMRTFDYLQGEEIIYNRRGVGYYVAPDEPLGCVCLDAGILIDTFSPVRADFLGI